MKQQLQQRLQQLKPDFKSGQEVLAELEAKQANVQNTMLRIQGAIQVIEEELVKAEEPKYSDDDLTKEQIEVSANSHG